MRAWMESRAVRTESAGLHSFLRMSRQMAPVTLETFGCQILVSNFIFGGWYGYSSGITMSIWNFPPS